jgi:hypothetical protein
MILAAWGAALAFALTAATVYPLDAWAHAGEPRWINLSGLLNGSCDANPRVVAVAFAANLGFGAGLLLAYWAFRDAYWADGRRARYWTGALGLYAFYVVLASPTGRELWIDAAHYSASSLGLALLSAYAAASLRGDRSAGALLQNAAAVAMWGSAAAVLVTCLSGEADRLGWNGFVAAEAAFGASFSAFLLSWGFAAEGARRPPWAPKRSA